AADVRRRAVDLEPNPRRDLVAILHLADRIASCARASRRRSRGFWTRTSVVRGGRPRLRRLARLAGIPDLGGLRLGDGTKPSSERASRRRLSARAIASAVAVPGPG